MRSAKDGVNLWLREDDGQWTRIFMGKCRPVPTDGNPATARRHDGGRPRPELTEGGESGHRLGGYGGCDRVRCVRTRAREWCFPVDWRAWTASLLG